jgi:hypothetical protein
MAANLHHPATDFVATPHPENQYRKSNRPTAMSQPNPNPQPQPATTNLPRNPAQPAPKAAPWPGASSPPAKKSTLESVAPLQLLPNSSQPQTPTYSKPTSLPPAAIASAASGCTAVFLNVSPTADPSAELTHAQTIISVCRASGVTKCVYSSVVNAGKQSAFKTSSPHGPAQPVDPATTFRAAYWLSKSAIQDAVVSAGFGAWTVLQPAFLLSNLVAPVSPGYFRELASQHVVRSAYRPDTEIAITDPVDLAKFAVAAFLTPKGAMLE